MATSADVIQDAVGGLHSLVEGALDDFWRTLDLSNPAAARDALLDFVPALVNEFGSQASLIAAEWYDELRAEQALPTAFRASLGDVIEAQYVQERVRFGAGSLWAEDQDQFLAFLKDAATGYVTQAFADTIVANGDRDPSSKGWARKPEPDACNFCLLLASRGGTYSTGRAATRVVGRGGRARGNQELGDKFHGSCRCVAVPVWETTDFQAEYGFDPVELEEMYRDGLLDARSSRQ